MYYSLKDNEVNPYYTYYTIKSGDTLYKIGEYFNVNPKLIAELNGLKDNEFIYPNQTLLIPKKGIQYYITKEDDTIKAVSNLFNTDVEQVVKQNQTIYLLPGQMIFLKDDRLY